MNNARIKLLVIAFLSGLASLATAGLMASRIVEFHKQHPRDLYVFQRVQDRAFSWASRPVTLEDDLKDPQSPLLTVHYGDQSKRLAVPIPGNLKLPGLVPYEDWLKVFRMAAGSGMRSDEFNAKMKTGEITERLLFVTRTPRPGTDPRTWGSVWKKDWVFDFYELMPTGEIVQYPRLKYPQRGGLRQPKPDELQENTWQFQAALQLMPQAGGVGPTHQFFGNALTAASWTLPVSVFFGLGFTFGLAFAFAPKKRNDKESLFEDPPRSSISGK
jgi:hypothetical protein